MSWWSKFLRSIDKKAKTASLQDETVVTTDSFVKLNNQGVPEYDIDRIRGLLFNGFTSKEILELAQTLNSHAIIERVKADKNKSHVVKAILDLGAYATILENAKLINQFKFDKYSPYVIPQDKSENTSKKNVVQEKINETALFFAREK